MKGHKLLITPKKVKEQLDKAVDDAGAETLKKMGFTVAISKDQEKQYEAATEVGTVVGIGNMAWKDPNLGYGLEGWEPWAEVGDEILYVRYSGKFVHDPYAKEGEETFYYIINDVDMQCLVKEA